MTNMNDSNNRRRFLKQAGAAGIGLGMAGYFGSLAKADSQTAPTSARKIGAKRLLVEDPARLHLRQAAIHKQFRARDVATVIGCEKHHGPRDLIGSAEPAERNSVGNHVQSFLPYF